MVRNDKGEVAVSQPTSFPVLRPDRSEIGPDSARALLTAPILTPVLDQPQVAAAPVRQNPNTCLKGAQMITNPHRIDVHHLGPLPSSMR